MTTHSGTLCDRGPGAINLLLVTPVYPPVLSPGTYRPMKLVKYFAACGVRPVVLTREPPADSVLDPDMAAEVEHVPCTRVSMPIDLARAGQRLAKADWVSQARPGPSGPRPRRGLMRALLLARDLLMFPDHMVVGVPAMCAAARRMVRAESIDAVCTTGPHHSIHLVGLWLKRRLHVPCWIADFRDAWVTDPKNVFPSRFHRWVNAGLESRVVRAADAVVTVSEPMRQDFLARYAHLDHRKFHTVYNGYDEQDFEDVAPVVHADGRIHIVHVGTIHDRSGAEDVVECLGRVLRGHPDLAPMVRLELVGQVHPAAWQAVCRKIERWSLADNVRFVGCVSHREAIAHMLGADYLLLITGPGREVVTTKVFEYMRSGRPVVLVCERDAEIRGIVQSARVVHWAADRTRMDDICGCIERSIRYVVSGNGQGPGRPDAGAACPFYSRQNAAARFAGLIRDVLCRSRFGKRG